MAFLIGGANTESGDLITNSLRFNGSNAYLNRTTSTASGNTKLTISFWTKGHSTGSSDVNYHFVKFDDVNNRTYLGMWDREIRFYQTTSGSAAFYYQTQSNAFADAAAFTFGNGLTNLSDSLPGLVNISPSSFGPSVTSKLEAIAFACSAENSGPPSSAKFL